MPFPRNPSAAPTTPVSAQALIDRVTSGQDLTAAQCSAKFEDHVRDALGTTLPHHGPVPTAQPLGNAPLSEPNIASLTDAASVNVPSNLLAPLDGIRVQPGKSTTVVRLKMTLHSVTPLVPTPTITDGVENPLTRCTFGAVYSPNPSEEDGVFGKATPFGSLSYNVRADLAEHLEVGQAYYVDIHKVPS